MIFLLRRTPGHPRMFHAARRNRLHRLLRARGLQLRIARLLFAMDASSNIIIGKQNCIPIPFTAPQEVAISAMEVILEEPGSSQLQLTIHQE